MRRRRRPSGTNQLSRFHVPARRALTHACASAGHAPLAGSPVQPAAADADESAKLKLSSAGADPPGTTIGSSAASTSSCDCVPNVARIVRPHGTPPSRAFGVGGAPSADARKSTTRPFVDASRRLCSCRPRAPAAEGPRSRRRSKDFVLRFCRRPSSGGVRGRKSRTASMALSVVDGAEGPCGVGDSISSSSRTTRAPRQLPSTGRPNLTRVARMRLAMLILTLLGISSGLCPSTPSVGSVVRSDRAAVRMNADDSVESTPAAAARLAELKAAGARARARRDEQSAMASAALALAREREPVKGTPGS